MVRGREMFWDLHGLPLHLARKGQINLEPPDVLNGTHFSDERPPIAVQLARPDAGIVRESREIRAWHVKPPLPPMRQCPGFRCSGQENCRKQIQHHHNRGHHLSRHQPEG